MGMSFVQWTYLFIRCNDDDVHAAINDVDDAAIGLADAGTTTKFTVQMNATRSSPFPQECGRGELVGMMIRIVDVLAHQVQR